MIGIRLTVVLSVMITFFVSCGEKKHYHTERIIETEKTDDKGGIDAKTIPDVPTNNTNSPKDEPIKLDGLYRFKDGAYVELFESDFELYIPNDGQFLTTLNPKNATYGELPALGLGRLSKKLVQRNTTLNSASFSLTKNVNYSAGNDIETDDTGSNIVGQRRTDISFTFTKGANGDTVLTIIVKIYENKIGSDVNRIIATREFKGE